VWHAPYPVYAASGSGCRITDVDGVERLDFVNNYSSLIHGHGHPPTIDAVRWQLQALTAAGLPTESEIGLAELLCARLPAVEQVRFLNSGTEAVMLALKTARAYTGRSRIAKVEGTYHGLYDFAEVSQAPTSQEWGPAEAPASVPLSPGTPRGVLDDVLVLPFNNVPATRKLLEQHGPSLAAVLLDVMPARLSYLKASPAFLGTIAEIARRFGTLIVLDEVYSLRLDYAGMHGKLGLKPDLIALAKIIGGGFPVGALGGDQRIMGLFRCDDRSPRLPHGGTYNANPITMAAGLAAMHAFDRNAVARLNELGNRAREAVREAARVAGIAVQVQGEGSVFAIRMGAQAPVDYRSSISTPEDLSRMDWLYRDLLNHGILYAPHGLFVLSTAMTGREVDQLGDTILGSFRRLAAGAAGLGPPEESSPPVD
jgi:glutamate-1-semialdehyde 2,1-aminomutase